MACCFYHDYRTDFVTAYYLKHFLQSSRGKTSSLCGPFQGYVNYVDFFWETIASEDEVVLMIISWVFKPGVVAGILIVLM